MRSTSLAGQKRRAIPLLLAFLILATVSVLAQDLTTAKPESVGLSSERLERIATAVQQRY